MFLNSSVKKSKGVSLHNVKAAERTPASRMRNRNMGDKGLVL